MASGPDYRDQDPIVALDDFKKRVALYQSKYVPLGEYEEKNNMPYVQMIDVGRKVVSHQIRGYVIFYIVNRVVLCCMDLIRGPEACFRSRKWLLPPTVPHCLIWEADIMF